MLGKYLSECGKDDHGGQGKGNFSMCNYMFDGFWKNETSNNTLVPNFKIASEVEILKSDITYEHSRYDLKKELIYNLVLDYKTGALLKVKT